MGKLFFVCQLLADRSVVCLCGKTKKELPKRVTPYFCGTTRNRTGDTRIFSPLLYQLSYGTIALICVCKDSTFVLTLQAFCEKCFVIVNFAFSLPFPAFLPLGFFSEIWTCPFNLFLFCLRRLLEPLRLLHRISLPFRRKSCHIFASRRYDIVDEDQVIKSLQ